MGIHTTLGMGAFGWAQHWHHTLRQGTALCPPNSCVSSVGLLEISPVERGVVSIFGVRSGLFVAMNSKGKLYGSVSSHPSGARGGDHGQLGWAVCMVLEAAQAPSLPLLSQATQSSPCCLANRRCAAHVCCLLSFWNKTHSFALHFLGSPIKTIAIKPWLLILPTTQTNRVVICVARPQASLSPYPSCI